MRFDYPALYFVAHAMGALIRGDYAGANILARMASDDWQTFDAIAIRGVVDFNTDRS